MAGGKNKGDNAQGQEKCTCTQNIQEVMENILGKQESMFKSFMAQQEKMFKALVDSIKDSTNTKIEALQNDLFNAAKTNDNIQKENVKKLSSLIAKANEKKLKKCRVN